MKVNKYSVLALYYELMVMIIIANNLLDFPIESSQFRMVCMF
jgi:hypothetical protein